MNSETIWRWFCSLSEAELTGSGEPILEMKLHADPRHGFEPVLVDELIDGALPELSLP